MNLAKRPPDLALPPQVEPVEVAPLVDVWLCEVDFQRASDLNLTVAEEFDVCYRKVVNVGIERHNDRWQHDSD